jgi:hypothetical protein
MSPLLLFKAMWSVILMSLTDSQIVDVALRVNSPESVDLLDVTTPTVSIVATNTGPRGPQGDSGQWVALTQNEYDLLNPPDPDTLYVIIQ